MNKLFTLIIFLSTSFSLAQELTCGFDIIQNELDSIYPELKADREKFNNELIRKKKFNLNNARILDNNSSEVYEVPVVVHVIESNTEENKRYKLTDEQIIKWIDNTNKMYASTYGNGFPTVGDGPNDGTAIPIKLVLAKRTPDCKPTNGIIRYDLSDNEEYNRSGLRFAGSNQGVTGSVIKKIAPHWPERGYYNIYVIIGIRGRKTPDDIYGWATPPNAPPNAYETFMKASIVAQPHNTIMAHEFGHAMGLLHTFHTANDHGGQCPSNDDCTRNNDNICDTESIQSLFGRRVPTNDEINPCTNVNYQGGQYNIMNYTNEPRKFTPGQRDKAIATFLSRWPTLVTSPAKYPPQKNFVEKPLLKPASCTPPRRLQGNRGVAITHVKFGDINNISSINDNFYVDQTLNSCYTSGTFTDIPDDKPNKLIIKGGIVHTYALTAWIDFNDNGIFESNEAFKRNTYHQPNKYIEFNIPLDKIQNAVKNKYLRMRIISDWEYKNSCDVLTYGETEDYAVRIVTKDFVDPDTIKSTGRIGINTQSPETTLDIKEVDLNNLPNGQPQGVSFPSFTTEDRNTFDKTKIKQGTMIYNTTEKCIEIFTNNDWNCLPFRN